jgi:hypothetical protein
MNASRGVCADCTVYTELINDTCRPCLEQQRLVFCERGLLQADTDEQREIWAGYYQAIIARNRL